VYRFLPECTGRKSKRQHHSEENHGKIAIIAGGSSGRVLATVRLFAENASVNITACRQNVLKTVMKAIGKTS